MIKILALNTIEAQNFEYENRVDLLCPFDDDCLFCVFIKKASSYLIFLVSSCSIVVVVLFYEVKIEITVQSPGVEVQGSFWHSDVHPYFWNVHC